MNSLLIILHVLNPYPANIFCPENVVFILLTQDRQQSKMPLTINERGSKIARNSVFNCHLLPVGRQMQTKTLFLAIFDLRSLIVFMFRLPLIRCVTSACIYSCAFQARFYHGSKHYEP